MNTATEREWSPRLNRTGVACENCGTPYGKCTDSVLDELQPCCGTCGVHGTHDEREAAGRPAEPARPVFAPPTWPSADDLVSDLIPTLPRVGASTGPSLRVGVRAGQVATLRAPGQITALDADGLDALIGALTEARDRLR